MPSRHNTMALDTSSCPNVPVHNSFEAQKPSLWEYTYNMQRTMTPIRLRPITLRVRAGLTQELLLA